MMRNVPDINRLGGENNANIVLAAQVISITGERECVPSVEIRFGANFEEGGLISMPVNIAMSDQNDFHSHFANGLDKIRGCVNIGNDHIERIDRFEGDKANPSQFAAICDQHNLT